jgi:hypothetical protein
MLLVPQGVNPQKSLLQVVAHAEQHGGTCADMYVRTLTITGRWADRKHPHLHAGGVQYYAWARDPRLSGWRQYGAVGLKVVWGHTATGVQYLNLLVRNLGHVGYPIGGLLGGGDHSQAAAPSGGCRHSVRSVSLLATDN